MLIEIDTKWLQDHHIYNKDVGKKTYTKCKEGLCVQFWGILGYSAWGFLWVNHIGWENAEDTCVFLLAWVKFVKVGLKVVLSENIRRLGTLISFSKFSSAKAMNIGICGTWIENRDGRGVGDPGGFIGWWFRVEDRRIFASCSCCHEFGCRYLNKKNLVRNRSKFYNTILLTSAIPSSLLVYFCEKFMFSLNSSWSRAWIISSSVRLESDYSFSADLSWVKTSRLCLARGSVAPLCKLVFWTLFNFWKSMVLD